MSMFVVNPNNKLLQILKYFLMQSKPRQWKLLQFMQRLSGLEGFFVALGGP